MYESDDDLAENLAVPCSSSKVPVRKAAAGGKRLGNPLYMISKDSYTWQNSAAFAATPDNLDRVKEPLAYCSKPHNVNLLSHDDKVLLCFFDPLHELRESKYKKHLLCCKAKTQQLPDKDYFMCKYNSIHFYRSQADKEQHETHYCKERSLGGHGDHIWGTIDEVEEASKQKKKSNGASPRTRPRRLFELDPRGEEEESSDSSCRDVKKGKTVANNGKSSKGGDLTSRESGKAAGKELWKDRRSNAARHSSEGMDGKCESVKYKGSLEEGEPLAMSYPIQSDYEERDFWVDRRTVGRRVQTSNDVVCSPKSSSSSPSETSSSSSSSGSSSSSDESNIPRRKRGIRRDTESTRQKAAGLQVRRAEPPVREFEKEWQHRRTSTTGRTGEEEMRLDKRATKDRQSCGRASQQRLLCHQSKVVTVNRRTVYSSSDTEDGRREKVKHRRKNRCEISEMAGRSPPDVVSRVRRPAEGKRRESTREISVDRGSPSCGWKEEGWWKDSGRKKRGGSERVVRQEDEKKGDARMGEVYRDRQVCLCHEKYVRDRLARGRRHYDSPSDEEEDRKARKVFERSNISREGITVLEKSNSSRESRKVLEKSNSNREGRTFLERSSQQRLLCHQSSVVTVSRRREYSSSDTEDGRRENVKQRRGIEERDDKKRCGQEERLDRRREGKRWVQAASYKSGGSVKEPDFRL
eukprot:GHVS01091330.1.p1 GENE.GHVS01091330.1~~GHVS01091330.1.p1  ORF type:complete len:693 (+),score=113.37 GHVS01091330.1:123-2201(+)